MVIPKTFFVTALGRSGTLFLAAILGLSARDVELVCQAAAAATGKIVTPANYNSPQQTVIAGDAVAIEAACSRARQEGAKRTIPLAVSAPFHCGLMAPAAEKLGLELARVHFREADVPVLTNVEATPNTDASRVRSLLETQVTAPVRFVEMVEKMVELGVTQVLEVGTGRVLSGLVARTARKLQRACLSTFGEMADAASFVSPAPGVDAR